MGKRKSSPRLATTSLMMLLHVVLTRTCVSIHGIPVRCLGECFMIR